MIAEELPCKTYTAFLPSTKNSLLKDEKMLCLQILGIHLNIISFNAALITRYPQKHLLKHLYLNRGDICLISYHRIFIKKAHIINCFINIISIFLNTFFFDYMTLPTKFQFGVQINGTFVTNKY